MKPLDSTKKHTNREIVEALNEVNKFLRSEVGSQGKILIDVQDKVTIANDVAYKASKRVEDLWEKFLPLESSYNEFIIRQDERKKTLEQVKDVTGRDVSKEITVREILKWTLKVLGFASAVISMVLGAKFLSG